MTVSPDGGPAPVALLAADALQLDADAWALWNHLYWLQASDMLLNLCSEVFFDGMSMLPPLRAAAPGGWRQIRTSLDGERQGCPSVPEKGKDGLELSRPERTSMSSTTGTPPSSLGGQTHHWRPMQWREWGEVTDRRAAEEVAEQKEREEKIQGAHRRRQEEPNKEAEGRSLKKRGRQLAGRLLRVRRRPDRRLPGARRRRGLRMGLSWRTETSGSRSHNSTR